MANGFFLGGMAEGIQSANKQDLADRTLAADTSLRTRGLDIQQQTADRLEKQSVLERGDKLISDTMSSAIETIKAGIAAGRDPAVIQKAVAPLVESAKQIAGKIGRDPTALDAQVQSALVSPNAIEAATVSGTAEGTKKAAAAVAEARALERAGVDTEATKWKDPKDRVTAENSLRDDYVKQSKDFVTMRDWKSRLDEIEKTGAGDVALVFTYMKLLDPTSTVREGEFASASNAAGVPSAVQGLYNKMLGGGILGDQARKDIKTQATRFYERSAKEHDKLTTQFANIAKRQNLRVDNVIVDLTPTQKKASTSGSASFADRFGGDSTPGASIPPPPPGFNLIR